MLTEEVVGGGAERTISAKLAKNPIWFWPAGDATTRSITSAGRFTARRADAPCTRPTRCTTAPPMFPSGRACSAREHPPDPISPNCSSPSRPSLPTCLHFAGRRGPVPPITRGRTDPGRSRGGQLDTVIHRRSLTRLPPGPPWRVPESGEPLHRTRRQATAGRPDFRRPRTARGARVPWLPSAELLAILHLGWLSDGRSKDQGPFPAAGAISGRGRRRGSGLSRRRLSRGGTRSGPGPGLSPQAHPWPCP